MATRKTQRSRSKSRRTPRRATRSRRPRNAARRRDAIGMLREDHERVIELFDRFETARGSDRKEKLARQICDELDLHAQIEEEIFYPAVRQAIGDDDLMNEALVEHQAAKDLITALRDTSSGDELFETRATVLGEYVKHHVKEEQNEMFPKARRSGVDLVALGEEMRARKEELATGMMGKLKRMIL